MALLTKYTNMTNADLVQHLTDVRHASPVINELCTRLEDKPEEYSGFDFDARCPVCEADLTIAVDYSDKLFTLEIQK